MNLLSKKLQQPLKVKFVQSQDSTSQAGTDFLRWLITKATEPKVEQQKKEAA
jgi:hypothetical protein